MIKVSKVKNVLRYLISKYPYESDLSKTRVTKMVYLADWYYALQYRKQITDIEWYFDHYGPYVPDVFKVAKNDKELEVKGSYSMYGSPKSIIVLKREDENIQFKLTKNEMDIIDKVIEETKNLSWNSFISKVYNTIPIKNGRKYESLDLVSYASESL